MKISKNWAVENV